MSQPTSSSTQVDSPGDYRIWVRKPASPNTQEKLEMDLDLYSYTDEIAGVLQCYGWIILERADGDAEEISIIKNMVLNQVCCFVILCRPVH